tara:strand:+ start:1274 stop:2461 length:1188 start_codon:yes stop_codon:yes gene_type:complete
MVKPVIALIPSGYKAEKVYSVVPSNGAGDFVFDRGNGAATRVNKDVLIEDVANDVPRLDYTDGGCPVLLLEYASSNNILYSQDFSQWTAFRLSTTANTTTSPSGLINATSITEDSTTNTHFLRAPVTAATGTWSYSIFAKNRTNNRYVVLNLRFSSARFNLSTGTVDEETGLVASSIKSFPNGWYRISITATLSALANVELTLNNGTTDNYLGDGLSGVYIWGAQFEEKPAPTSYIPALTGISVTRLIDSCLGNYSPILLNKEVSLFADVIQNNTGFDMTIGLTNASPLSNLIFIFQANGTQVRVVSSQGLDSYQTITTYQRNKIIVTLKLNEAKIYINGSLVLTQNTSLTVPDTFGELNFAAFLGGSPFSGRVYDTRVYDTVLTEAEAKQLTTT